MNQIRIAKLLANWGYGTRNQCRALMRDGRVTLHSAPVTDTKALVTYDGAGLAVDGEPAYWRPAPDDALASRIEQMLLGGLREEAVFDWARSQGCSKRGAAKLIGYFMRPGGTIRQERKSGGPPPVVAAPGRQSSSKKKKNNKKRKSGQRNASVNEAIHSEVSSLLNMGYSMEEIRALMGDRFPGTQPSVTQSRRHRSKFFRDKDTADSGHHGFPDDLASREVLDHLLDEVSQAFSVHRGALERNLPRGWPDMRIAELRTRMEALARSPKHQERSATREELLLVVYKVAANNDIPLGTLKCKMPKGWLNMSPAELEAAMSSVARAPNYQPGGAGTARVPVEPPSPGKSTESAQYARRKALEEAMALFELGCTADEVVAIIGDDSPSQKALQSLQLALTQTSQSTPQEHLEEDAVIGDTGWGADEDEEEIGRTTASYREVRGFEEPNVRSPLARTGHRRSVVRRRRESSKSNGNGRDEPTSGREPSPRAVAPGSAHPPKTVVTRAPTERVADNQALPELPPGWDDL